MPKLMIALLLVIGPMMAIASAPHADNGIMLVVFPPWASPEVLVTASQGVIVGPETASMAVYATGPLPGFADALRRNGAWAVIDASHLAAICGVER